MYTNMLGSLLFPVLRWLPLWALLISHSRLKKTTAGIYYAKKRRTVPPGYFGHYVSNSRHMLKPAGIHSLVSMADKWADDVPVESDDRYRKIGDKVILQVPENHIAGGYRVGEASAGALDQEFVLFSQGRHVLPDAKYNGVCIIKLDKQQDKLGPLHVLHVREGFLGGVYERKTGVCKILYPGPPYLLHEQEYESVELVQRTSAVFKLGPYEFVTVKDGEVAGSYRKDGTFQILPPGHSYQLHSKDFSPVQVVGRATQFTLGPYYYLTVRNGVEAGVYRKKDGLFQRLPAGATYQLNQDTYREPVHVVRDSHVCRVGPLTLVTVQDGFLNGAYRISDGAFVEFSDTDKEYILHEKEFFGLSTVTKHSTELQMFGPYKVITIREGEVGHFERQGSIEVKAPGFYKVSAEYDIKEPIPMRMFQETLPNVQFRTKDGVQMGVKFSITWHVDQPVMVAKFNGDFRTLRELMAGRARDALVRLCTMCGRGDLLPTKHDTASVATSTRRVPGSVDSAGSAGVVHPHADLDADAERDDAEQRSERAAADAHRGLVEELSSMCRQELQAISDTNQLGIAIDSIPIEQFSLQDESILQDLEDMTKAELAKKAEKVRGELAIAKTGFEMKVRERRAVAEAEYVKGRAQDEIAAQELREKAEAAINLARQEAELEARAQRTAAEAKLAQAAEKAAGELSMARANNDLLRIAAENKARAEESEAAAMIKCKEEETAAAIAAQRVVMEAEAEAKAIAAIATAEHTRKMQECEAAAHMAPQDFELSKLRIQKEMQVEMMAGIGQAAWKYPDVYTGFLEQIGDVMKAAPSKGQQSMAGLMPNLLATAQHKLQHQCPPAANLPRLSQDVGLDKTGKMMLRSLVQRHNLLKPLGAASG